MEACGNILFSIGVLCYILLKTIMTTYLYFSFGIYAWHRRIMNSKLINLKKISNLEVVDRGTSITIRGFREI